MSTDPAAASTAGGKPFGHGERLDGTHNFQLTSYSSVIVYDRKTERLVFCGALRALEAALQLQSIVDLSEIRKKSTATESA